MLSAWLAHPLTRGLDLDDPRTTELRRDIVRSKPFLERIYRDWYRSLAGDLPTGPGDVLEIGSGAGFFREYVPSLITSDLMPVPGVDRVIDAHDLPFAPGALRGIAMTNVFHHLAQPRRFLAEAVRCLRPGGVVTLLEPWVTPWSCFVFQKINDEPFLPDAREWSFESTGPLSSANGALAWIIFHRDRAQFEAEFPQLRIASIQPTMPFRYPASGGLRLRNVMPAWTYPLWAGFEQALRPAWRWLAMFARFTLVRV